MLKKALLTAALVTMSIGSSAQARVFDGVPFGRRQVSTPRGLGGVCYVETWRSPTSLSRLGGCTSIVYMIDVQDRRFGPLRVGLSAKIWLIDGMKRHLMATITVRQSGAGFRFDPRRYQNAVRWSNGEVKFLVELAPGGVRIRSTRCRYVFRR